MLCFYVALFGNKNEISCNAKFLSIKTIASIYTERTRSRLFLVNTYFSVACKNYFNIRGDINSLISNLIMKNIYFSCIIGKTTHTVPTKTSVWDFLQRIYFFLHVCRSLWLDLMAFMDVWIFHSAL